MRHRFTFVLIAILLASIASACAAPTATESVAIPQEEQISSIVVAIGGESEEGYDPTLGWGRYGSPLFQSTLLQRDDQMQIVNDLATGYQVSDDGLTWTVTIREDAKFSDGSPVTAEDVAYTFETASQTAGLAPDLAALQSVEAVDASTVAFHLEHPESTFLHRLVTLGIVPKAQHNADYAQHPVGSGPYKMVEWQRGQQLIVEANPYYYGPRPAIERVTFLFLSEEAALAAAQAGQVDLVSIPSAYAGQTPEGMDLVVVESVENRGIMFPVVPDEGKQTDSGYPVGNDVTADLAIRQAINYAVDRAALVQGALNGYGSPAYGPANGMPWDNAETHLQDNDLETARSILASGGWSLENGILVKDGLKAEFTLITPAGDKMRESLSLAVAEMVKPLGIKITVESRSWDDIERLMHANAVLMGWGSHDPSEIYNLYHSSYIAQGWYNPGYYSNPTVDSYLDAALTAHSEADAILYWQKAQWDGETGFAAQGDAAWAWLVNVEHLYFKSACLDIGTSHIEPHGHGWPITANITDWSLTCGE